MIRQKNHLPLAFLLLGGVILMVSFMWPQPANAQCGTSASSCKNCHEVQAEYLVNNDGTSWHEAHAFGDFCEFCHAGNVQATDIEGAHTGMEAPLDNIQASCSSCHAADLNERAEVYATALGVAIGGGSNGDNSGGTTSGGETADTATSDAAAATTENSTTTSAPAAPPPAAPTGMVVDDPNVIDYVARYNETVLGIVPVNWGNRILVGLIVAMILGGGGYVLFNEKELRRKKIPVSAAIVAEQTTNYPQYSAEIVALLPRIAKLSTPAVANLFHFLENPAKAEILLQDLGRLEPELVNQVRSLDRESQALLLALATSGD